MNFNYINGIKIYAPESKNQFLNFIIKNKLILIALNAEKIMLSTEKIKNIINRNIGYPDGIGAVWALKKKGYKKVFKIPGCDLWLEIIKKYHYNKTFYLIGAKQKVINETVDKLHLDFPNIKIINFRNGYFKNKEEESLLINDVKKTKPDFVFVAMGSPNQEILMNKLQKEYKSVYVGLGGSFDVFTNNIKRAPKMWINSNLEWAYRLFNEPKRIKRQIVYIPFLIRLIFNKF